MRCIYLNSKNKDSFKIVNVSTRISKDKNLNRYLINKRKFQSYGISFSVPDKIAYFIENKVNGNCRTHYIESLLEKYKNILEIAENKLFFTLSEFFRFLIYLEYFSYRIDIPFEVLIKPEIKNGFLAEIDGGIEYLREYDNNEIISERIIKKQK
jgi:hypothetical protein